jgi:hypothetical protein
MLHKVKSSYREIAKYLPKKVNNATRGEASRRLLLEMAREGLPRPTQKTKIGKTLSEFTKPSSRSYKPQFHRTLKDARPDWFVSQTEIANLKKKELLRMARQGEKRPSHDKTKLGQALSNYTRKRSPAYDPEFDMKIRKLRPEWF